jgi:UDP-N-acetyl-D-glucosamine/UDP-N-acetyl-D-galactosamine dehydrogenase
MKLNNLKLAIIGLGYVGLSLAVEFAKKRNVIGFDIKKKRIRELKNGKDCNLEETKQALKTSKLLLTNNLKDLKFANCYIITIPTPVDSKKKPDLKLLFMATKAIGKILKYGDIIIYESTVYPGCTEEECVPILEKYSGLKFNKDFYCGYSPERVNPGDKEHRISTIKKITSGSTPEIANLIDQLYNQIIIVGTHKAASIKIAEAAKVIENTQRDLNIALVNELAIIFNKLNIDTQSVLEAAKTKWNFLPFYPGLVGGHCIGVDPYYLTFKAQQIGYSPKIILAGRKLNDNMGAYVVSQLKTEMRKKSIDIKKSKVLIMGLTFKENCPDLRNSGAVNIIKELKKNNCKFDLYDPWANNFEVKKIYKTKPKKKLIQNTYDAILLTVAHHEFKKMNFENLIKLCKKNHVIYDLKYIYSVNQTSFRL